LGIHIHEKIDCFRGTEVSRSGKGRLLFLVAGLLILKKCYKSVLNLTLVISNVLSQIPIDNSSALLYCN
jgi:hypothetical protein